MNFDRAGETRHGLPGSAYIDNEFFRLEQSCLFGQGWVFVGYAHQMDKVGDVRSTYRRRGAAAIVKW